MQVFIIGSPFDTAMVLDQKRLNRQIQETEVILAALNGAKAWSHHPVVLQYIGYEKWLRGYLIVLDCYARGNTRLAAFFDVETERVRPHWHTDEYFNQMKRRLFTKNPKHYKQWADLGFSDENWYWSQDENKFIKYINGKRIE